MARMKWGSDINWRDLDSAEYDESQEFEDYEGPVPPSNKLLSGDVKKIWATESAKGDPMLKVLFVAAGNTGNKKQFNGCPIWDNVLFTMPQVKFRWDPFLRAFGLTLADLKNKTVVGDEETNGAVVRKIGSVSFEKLVPARIRTQKENSEDYGEQCRVGRWLPAKDADEDIDADDEYEDDDETEADPF